MSGAGAHRRRPERMARSLGTAVVAVATVVAGIVVTDVLGSPAASTAAHSGAAASGAASVAGAASGAASVAAVAPSVSASVVPSVAGVPSVSASAAAVAVRPVAADPAISDRAPVVVLNDTSITGLAARVAARLRAAGWVVPWIGNLADRVPETTVYYDADQRRAGEVLLRAGLGVRAALPRQPWLASTGTLILVVTRDYQLS
ncbi:MAG: LytR C-terminal domain-containing protein [Mycobacteriales bacterium]